MKLRKLTTILLLALTSFFTGTPSGDAAFYPETRVRGQNLQIADFVKASNLLVAESHQVTQQFSYNLTVDCLVAPKNTTKTDRIKSHLTVRDLGLVQNWVTGPISLSLSFLLLVLVLDFFDDEGRGRGRTWMLP